jgi:hypothetical protein
MNKEPVRQGASLECGDLSPLWYWGVVDDEIRCTKAVTSPRTPRRRPALPVLFLVLLVL